MYCQMYYREEDRRIIYINDNGGPYPLDFSVDFIPGALKAELISVTLEAGGTGEVEFANEYTDTPICVPVVIFDGDIQLTAVIGAATETGVIVTGKKSVAAASIGNPLFEDAEEGDTVRILVIGKISGLVDPLPPPI